MCTWAADFGSKFECSIYTNERDITYNCNNSSYNMCMHYISHALAEYVIVINWEPRNYGSK